MAMHCYDIIVAGDFRRSLCKITTIPDQLNALVSADYRVGILQLTSPLLDRSEGIDPSIRALIDQEQLAYLDPQQSLSARLLLATDSRLFHTRRGVCCVSGPTIALSLYPKARRCLLTLRRRI